METLLEAHTTTTGWGNPNISAPLWIWIQMEAYQGRWSVHQSMVGCQRQQPRCCSGGAQCLCRLGPKGGKQPSSVIFMSKNLFTSLHIHLFKVKGAGRWGIKQDNTRVCAGPTEGRSKRNRCSRRAKIHNSRREPVHRGLVSTTNWWTGSSGHGTLQVRSWMRLFFKYGCEITINLFIVQVGNADGWEEQESRGVGRGFDKFETKKCWQCLSL